MAKKPAANPPAAEHPAGPVAVQAIDVALIERHPLNARSTPRSEQDMRALTDSVREVGVLIPVVLAPLDAIGDERSRYGAVAGWGRVQAAKAAGYKDVPAMVYDCGDAALAQLSAVENEVRAAMHPVDQWRALARLTGAGISVKDAGATLGLSEREAQKLARLADMAPPVLEAMTKYGVPMPHEIGMIANAPHAQQLAALKAGMDKQGKSVLVNWHRVASACRIKRIPRTWAIFDPATAGVPFEEDLFVDANSHDAWTTTAIDQFREAQQAAIDAYIAKHGDLVMQALWNDETGSPVVAKNWQASVFLHEFPKNGPPFELRLDQRMVLALRPQGNVTVRIFTVPAEKGQASPSGIVPATSKPPRMITDAGLQMAATMKQQAFAQQMHVAATALEPIAATEYMLRTLLACLDAANVTPGSAPLTGRLDVLEKSPELMPLLDLAANTISAMLLFPAPKTPNHSGQVADRIAAGIGASAYLPRFDTREFLAECSGALLKEAARTVTMQPGQRAPKGVDALREFLVGKLPDWRPVGFIASA